MKQWASVLQPCALFPNLLLRMKVTWLEIQQRKNRMKRTTKTKSPAACDSNPREKMAPSCGSLIPAKEGASLKLLVLFCLHVLEKSITDVKK